MANLVTILTIFMAVSFISGHVHECNHVGNDNIDVYTSEETSLLRAATFTPAPIRLTYDDTEIQNLTDKNLKKLLSKAVKTALMFYKDLIIIKKPNPSSIVVTDKQCNGYNFVSYPSQSNSDFHVYIQLKQLSNTTIASAMACQLNGDLDNRPELAVINLNSNYIQTLQNDYYNFQTIQKVTIHELFHAIANSPGLYSQYVTSGTYKDNSLAFPNILKWARDHYGCQGITSFPLESNGGVGSKGAHWPRDFLNNDINTASFLQGNMVWSGINNAMILDSGWYDIKNSELKSDPILWGSNRGCSFLKAGACDTSLSEYCTDSGQQNTFTYSGIGICTSANKDIDIFATCPYVYLYSNMECQNPNNNFNKYNIPLFNNFNVVFGSTSAAFQSNLQPKSTQDLSTDTLLCYPQKCSSDGTKIYIEFDQVTLTCESDGQIIKAPATSNFKGQLTCPKISDFCQKQLQCEDFCSSNGYCLDGKCHCIDNAYGDQCQCSENSDLNQASCKRVIVQNCHVYDESGSCIKCFGSFNLSENSCLYSFSAHLSSFSALFISLIILTALSMI